METAGIHLTGLDEHSAAGHELLEEGEPCAAHSAFDNWVSSVARWLNGISPDSGLSSEWLGLPQSHLVMGGSYYDEPAAWDSFRGAVQRRLAWLGQLSTRVQDMNAMPALTQTAARERGRREIRMQMTARAYVDPDRIAELKEISHPEFDLKKLVRFSEELNLCFATECYLAVAMLTRAVIDHVPPVFGCQSFAELANNYAGGSKSFKESMRNLENSSRKIADQHLHCPIRRSEALPNSRQVDFGNDLDVLLAEIARSLRST
jgi:hypothetical protein